jgi:hypothetical protein
MDKKKFFQAVLAFVMLLNFVPVGFAQGTTSRVTGVVLDPNGAVVPSAKVTLTNEGTKVAFTSETSSTGTYAFESVQIGAYTLTIEKEGFKKSVAANNNHQSHA